MAQPSGTGPRRPWRVLVLVIIALVLLLFAFALWSEDEDLETLPPDEIQNVEGSGG